MDAEQMRVLERNPRRVRSQSQRVTERTIIQKPTFLSLQRERIHPVRSKKFERRLAKVNLVPACSRRDFMSEIVSNGVKVRVLKTLILRVPASILPIYIFQLTLVRYHEHL